VNKMNTPALKTYAERLRYALAVRGMDQTELGQKIGTKPQTVQRLCANGVRSVFTVNIAKALNISAEWLADGVGDFELPVKNEFLDEMSDKDLIDRQLIELMVDRMVNKRDRELIDRVNRLSEKDRETIEMKVDNFIQEQK